MPASSPRCTVRGWSLQTKERLMASSGQWTPTPTGPVPSLGSAWEASV